MLKRIPIALLLLLISACASKPLLDLQGINRNVTPDDARTDIALHQNENVLWGGIIVASQNLEPGSKLEILAYPLASNLRPNTEQRAYSRFIADYDKYLETVDFAAGRLVTLTGTLIDLQAGKIGDMEYQYPHVNAHEIHLWPLSGEDNPSGSQFHFGFGVSIHN